MGVVLADNLDFFNAVLAKYFSKKFGKGGMGLTNNIVRLTYEFGRMFRRKKLEVNGGKNCTFDTLLRKNAIKGFTQAYAVRQIRQVNHMVQGSMNWSVYELIIPMEDIEQHLASDEDSIFDMFETRLEAGMSEAAEEMETTWFHPTGSALLLSGENPPFAGLKYFVTRNGYHVDGTASVSGISGVTDPRWLNRYVGPTGSNLNPDRTHETAANKVITSGNQLLFFTNRMAQHLRFGSPGTGKTPAADKDNDANVAKDDLAILVDDLGYRAWELIQASSGHGQDKVAPEETLKPAPHYRGTPITFIEDLGIGSGGLPTGVRSDGGALTDRGTFVAGEHANTGEQFMLNYRNFRPIGLKGVAPLVKKAAYIEQVQATQQLTRWMLTPVCTSRMRQGVIWGFSEALAA